MGLTSFVSVVRVGSLVAPLGLGGGRVGVFAAADGAGCSQEVECVDGQDQPVGVRVEHP